jgi:hypothetical protein
MTSQPQFEHEIGLAAGPAVVPQAGKLAKGSLRTIDAIAISISVLSPADGLGGLRLHLRQP